jgi:hypothetical protein
MPPRQTPPPTVARNLPGASRKTEPQTVKVTSDGDTNSESASADYPSADVPFDASGIRATTPPAGFYDDPKKAPADKILTEEAKLPPRFAEKPEQGPKPKAGPPTLDEWQDFFARVVFLTLAEWYVSWAFRGIPEEVISDEDLQRCVLSREERQVIAQPLSELANKSSIARKHGRQVIAFFESAEAFILIGMWMAKVHRVASKYKPKKEGRRERLGPDAPAGNGANTRPAFDPSIQVFNPGTG